MDCDTSGLSEREALDVISRCVARIPGGADPWQFGWEQLIPLVVAIVAVLGVLATIRQQHAASRSDQLWARMSWAIERALEKDDDTKMAGLLAIERLLDSADLKRAGFKLSSLDEGILDDVSRTALPPSRGGSQ